MKTCNSVYMEDQLKCRLFVLCSLEIIFSFLIKVINEKAEEHLIIGMTLVHSVISIVFKYLAFLKLEF